MQAAENSEEEVGCVEERADASHDGATHHVAPRKFSTHASIPAPAPSSARPTIANGVLTSCFLSLLLPSIRLQTPLARVQDNSGIAIATIIRDNGCSCDC